MKLSSHDCATELRTLHLRATPARLGVLSILEHAKKPLDVSTIISALAAKHIAADDVTVFRMLNTFTQKGIVRSIQLREGKFRYEYAATSDHHHFVCEECGDIEDVEECNVDTIVKKLMRDRGVMVKNHSLEFFGLCKLCVA